MQSAYHNLPKINNCDQKNGKRYAARNVKYRKGALEMDIAGAYPDSAGVKRWTRKVSIDRRGIVTIDDSYELSRGNAPQQLMLVSAVEPKVDESGILLGSCRLRMNNAVVDVKVEPLADKFDPMMQSMWPDGLWRIVLSVKGRSVIKVTQLLGS